MLSVTSDTEDTRLLIRVELASSNPTTSTTTDPTLISQIAQAILNQLLRLNSEFANYVPKEQQFPRIELFSLGDARFFKIGVKHSYIQC